MTKDFIMVCRHDNNIAAIRITRSQDFGTVVKKICERWADLDPDSVILQYSIRDDKDLVLDNDDDLVTMFERADRAGIEDVTVDVKDGCKDFGNDSAEYMKRNLYFGSGSQGKQVMGIDEDDIIPSFCSHKKVNLLSSEWSEGITRVGQKFDGGAYEAKDVIRKYAVERGFQYVLTKNDKERVTAHCKYRNDKGCMWHVHCRVFPGTEVFYVKEMNLDHSCGVAVRTLVSPHATAKLVANLVGDDVRNKHRTRPVEVVKEIKKSYGIDIAYHQAWWGVEKAKEQTYGDDARSFVDLKWYIGAAMSANPGSRIELESDEENRFKRIFIAFGACIKGFTHCRPLLFVDAAHLKGRYLGTIMAATGKDGNQGIYPLAFAVVDSETYENWCWFFEHLRSVIPPERDVTFISDRNNGLIMARRHVFPVAGHGYCILHLKRNLRDHLRGGTKAHRERMVNLFAQCAYAPTRDLFQHNMTALQNGGGDRVKEFLTNLHPENWTNAFFVGNRFGEMTSNVAESFNAWIEDARDLPITGLIDSLRVKIMKMISQRREEASRWGCKICPEMDKRLRAAFNESRTWAVSLADGGVYEVHSFPSVKVDIQRRVCSCMQWQLEGFPCAHTVVVLSSIGSDLIDYIDDYYSAQTFHAVYSYSIQPVPTMWMPERQMDEDHLLPPKCKRPPGRPKKKRIPSRGEDTTLIRCGRCKKMGRHNRQSCRAPM